MTSDPIENVPAARASSSALRPMASARMPRPFGEQIREWRRKRELTQLELAVRAEVSPKHLSFLETGRSQPSRAMLLRLAERLALPRADRDWLLVAAGYAPMYSTFSFPAALTARGEAGAVGGTQR